MDLLDVIEIGTRTPWRWARRCACLIGVLLIFGWMAKWPVAQPLIQSVVDGQAEWATERFTSISR